LLAEEGLRRIGATELTLRSGSGKHGPIITERGNLIVDATFPAIHAHTEREIKELVGVVDSGLFTGYVSEVVIASSKGLTVLKDG
jgi:ribose 5-phosphate isomerase A